MMSNPGAGPDPEALRWAQEMLGGIVLARPLTGDLSPRRYWRLDGSGWLLATHPEDALDVLCRFELTSAVLTDLGIRVPRLAALDRERGWLLVEDLGPHTLHDLDDGKRGLAAALTRSAAIAEAVSALPMLPPGVLPPLDAPALCAEVERTVEHALLPLGFLSVSEARALLALVDELCRDIASELAPAHRDFMVRNLVPLVDEIGVLDHQDLRLAPRGYDLASLLVDSVDLAPTLRAELEAALVPPGLRGAWAAAASQRCLKIVGTFVSFANRGIRRHLTLVPRTLAQLARVSAEVPVLEPWSARFTTWAHLAECDPRLRV